MNFPSSPTLNQTYTLGTKTWVWNGSAWDLQINSLTYTPLATATSSDGSIVVSQVGANIDLIVSEASPASTLLAAVRNTTGATLTKGTAVYISGATGQRSTVSKALATGDATSAQTLGLITADLANNSNGYVTVVGLVTNMNTSAYTDGQQLYLSPTTAGTLTATKPYAPQHLVYVAIVEYAHPTQGKLFVKVQNGYEMDELHNVSAQSPTTGQTLVYNSSNSLWEKNTVSLTAGVNGTLPVANGGTGVTTSTGSGNNVLATSPTLVTPLLGTPTSATLTNATGLPLTTGVTGTLPVANGGTGTTTPSIVAGTNVTVTGTWPNQTIAASGGVATATTVSDTANSSTGYFALPVGTTGQRPGALVSGMTRYNTTIGTPEWSDGTNWYAYSISPNYTAEFLVIAGGGGGAGTSGGGSFGGSAGGAGGYRSSIAGESSGGGASAESSLAFSTGISYTVIVGAGGNGSADAVAGQTGSNSSISGSTITTITSLGGGFGVPYAGSAGSGGSGGGGAASQGTGGSGTTGQGYAGGTGGVGGTSGSAAGGGAGSVGGNGNGDGTGGIGGTGVSSSATGTAVTRGGGGGGGGCYVAGGTASGGGGRGGTGIGTNGANGTANTGGGGGGASSSNSGSVKQTGGNGGSGIVIIRYLGAQRGTGGTVTTASGYTIHTFTSNGTYIA